MTRLPTESSAVRWRQRAKYVVQPVFGPLWHVLLLVCLPATEKSEVITYKQLKWQWQWQVSTAAACLYFLYCISDLLRFFFTILSFKMNSSVTPFPILAHLSTNRLSADAYIICFQRRADRFWKTAWQQTWHVWKRLSAVCPNGNVYADTFVGPYYTLQFILIKTTK